MNAEEAYKFLRNKYNDFSDVDGIDTLGFAKDIYNLFKEMNQEEAKKFSEMAARILKPKQSLDMALYLEDLMLKDVAEKSRQIEERVKGNGHLPLK